MMTLDHLVTKVIIIHLSCNKCNGNPSSSFRDISKMLTATSWWLTKCKWMYCLWERRMSDLLVALEQSEDSSSGDH